MRRCLRVQNEETGASHHREHGDQLTQIFTGRCVILLWDLKSF